MRRYLDIIRNRKSGHLTHTTVASLSEEGERINERNEQSRLVPGQRVRWSHETIGRVVLVDAKGWIAVQCEPVELVFLRADDRIHIVKE